MNETDNQIPEESEDNSLLDTELAKDSNLLPKQELFCQLYATHQEFFGNGVQSYIEAYEPDTTKPNWYKTACSAASRLLSNVKVIERINAILEETGLNDAAVDKQMAFLITQHADFTNKLGAIKEYNKVKGRIIDKKDITSKGDKVVGITFAFEEDESEQGNQNNNQTDEQAEGSLAQVIVPE